VMVMLAAGLSLCRQTPAESSPRFAIIAEPPVGDGLLAPSSTAVTARL
jgi:hypothetical protein